LKNAVIIEAFTKPRRFAGGGNDGALARLERCRRAGVIKKTVVILSGAFGGFATMAE